jgi:hypothetical protein
MAKLLDHVLGEDESDDIFNRDEISAMMQIIREERNQSKLVESSRLSDKSGQPYAPPNIGNKSPDTNPPHSGDSNEEELSNNEMTVISGVLSLAKIRVIDIFIPLNRVNMLSSSQILNKEVIDVIDRVGHSRLPIFRDNNMKDIIGFFLVKRLMKVNPEVNTPLSSLPINDALVVGLVFIYLIVIMINLYLFV